MDKKNSGEVPFSFPSRRSALFLNGLADGAHLMKANYGTRSHQSPQGMGIYLQKS